MGSMDSTDISVYMDASRALYNVFLVNMMNV